MQADRHRNSEVKLKTRPLAFAAVVSVVLHCGAFYIASAVDKEIRLQNNLMQQRQHNQPRHQFYRAHFFQAQPQQSPAVTPAAAQQQNARASEQHPGNQAASMDEPALDESAQPAPEASETLELGDFLTADQLTSEATPKGMVNLDDIQITEPIKPGTLALKIWIDSAGRAVRTEIERTDFPAAYTEAVARAFSASAYSPGQVEGVRVNSVVRIEFSYD